MQIRRTPTACFEELFTWRQLVIGTFPEYGYGTLCVRPGPHVWLGLACMGRAHDGGLVCLHAAVTVGPPPALLSGGAATMASTSWQSAPGSSQHHTPSL